MSLAHLIRLLNVLQQRNTFSTLRCNYLSQRQIQRCERVHCSGIWIALLI